MTEWLDWQHISLQHKPVSEDGKTCMTCTRSLDTHWYPRVNPKKMLDEVADIVDEANRKLLE